MPQDQLFEWVARLETRLLIVVICAILVRHTNTIICALFSMPENWIKLLVEMLIRRK